MKKTLVLTCEYYPFKGGVARYVYNLFKYYPREDYLVITDHLEVKTKDNIINLKLTSKFIWPTWLFSFFKLKKIIKEHKIEQIFTPNILPLGSLAYFLKLPYIISLHGLDINLALVNKPKLTKKILQQAKYILVNSLHTKQSLEGLGVEDKVKLFYPSIDLVKEYEESKLNELKNKLNIGVEDKVLLTVGRLNKRKNHSLVIEALAKINKVNLKYLIVGSGEEQVNLEKLIKDNSLEDRVKIINQVEDNDLIYYYTLADIFIMPHRQTKTDIEGFGMVFLEAASCKLPIIAGNSGGVKEILNEQNALLIEPNLDNVIQSINTLTTNLLLANILSQAAYTTSQRFLSAQQQSDKLKEIL